MELLNHYFSHREVARNTWMGIKVKGSVEYKNYTLLESRRMKSPARPIILIHCQWYIKTKSNFWNRIEGLSNKLKYKSTNQILTKLLGQTEWTIWNAGYHQHLQERRSQHHYSNYLEPLVSNCRKSIPSMESLARHAWLFGASHTRLII